MKKIVFLFFLIIFSTLSIGMEPPKNWPWIGGNLNFSAPSDSRPLMVNFWAKKGANAIQIKLTPRRMAKRMGWSGEKAWQQSLLWADRVLDYCKKNGIVGIITFVQVPIEPELGLTQQSLEFWESAELKQKALSRIGETVQHFAERGDELAAYEFINEPLVRLSSGKVYTPKDWVSYQEKIVAEVRKYDDSRYVVVNAGYGGEASAYRNFKPLEDKRLVYGAHFYNPHSFTHQGLHGRDKIYKYPGMISGQLWNKAKLESVLEPLVKFKNEYNVLVWIGEFSSVTWERSSKQWICDAVELFNKNDFAWSYWSLVGHYAWNPFYDVSRTNNHDKPLFINKTGLKSRRIKLVEDLFENGKCTVGY